MLDQRARLRRHHSRREPLRFDHVQNSRHSGVISLPGQGPKSTVDTFHEQSCISLFLSLVKAGHRIVHLNLQCRQPSVFFTPLNQLHYDIQITTAARLKKSLTENLTVISEIAGRSSKEIDQCPETYCWLRWTVPP
jgi:hypothetical protein